MHVQALNILMNIKKHQIQVQGIALGYTVYIHNTFLIYYHFLTTF